ncbi:MAG: trypsin-like serine protease [Bacteriovoracaceae bacterium]
MKMITFHLYPLLLILFCLISCVPDQSQLSKSSIINGVMPRPEDKNINSTVAVSLLRRTSHCSGVLITPQVVLTAAHCIYPDSSFEVRMGNEINFSKQKPVSVKEVIIHPDYTDERTQNDIAIMILEQPLSNNVAPLYQGDILSQKGLPLFVAGYSSISSISNLDAFALVRKEEISTHRTNLGFNEDDGSFTQKLLFRMVTVITDVKNDKDKLVYLQSNGGVCSGDSGGPTFIKLKGNYLLIGINASVQYDKKQFCASWGASTFIPYYLDWITRVLDEKKLSKELKVSYFKFDEFFKALDFGEYLCSRVNLKWMEQFQNQMPNPAQLDYCNLGQRFLSDSQDLSDLCKSQCATQIANQNFCEVYEVGVKRFKQEYSSYCSQ